MRIGIGFFASSTGSGAPGSTAALAVETVRATDYPASPYTVDSTTLDYWVHCTGLTGGERVYFIGNDGYAGSLRIFSDAGISLIGGSVGNLNGLYSDTISFTSGYSAVWVCFSRAEAQKNRTITSRVGP